MEIIDCYKADLENASEIIAEQSEETKQLKERLSKASLLVRHYTYSKTITIGKKQTKENILELKNEELEELMKLLEG